MDREIQRADFVALVCTETYLQRVEGRQLPGKGRGVLWEAKLIYNLLYAEDTTLQRFIPLVLDSGRQASIPLPLRGLTYYQAGTDQGYEDFYRHLTAQPRHEKPALGKLKALPAIEPQSYPASLEVRTERKTPTSLDQRNRLQMLKRIRLDWIDGVLKQSLYQVARIELGLQTQIDAVEQPLKAIVQSPGHPPAAVPAGTPISQVFDDLGSALLILGAPGTGKTTLLLELAESLLDRAEQDPTHPIPVVFNLSSWAVRRQSLDRWMVTELNERSDVPKKLAEQWIESEQLIPLLDGLDEVALSHRQACAEAINDFRRDHGLLPISVCSRVADYEALGTKLRLRSAVIVQPLSKPEVEGYLERVGGRMHALYIALEKSPSFWELLETPLMLWVAMLAYWGAPIEFSVSDSFEQRRTRLFASFVDAMFKRRSAESRYSPEQTISWLCWLASALSRNKQTVFYLENLNAMWLQTRLQRWLARAGIILGTGLVSGMGNALIAAIGVGLVYGHGGPENDFLVVVSVVGGIALVMGLSFGLVGTFMDLQPSGTVRIILNRLSSRLPRAGRMGLLGGLCLVLVFVTVGLVELSLWDTSGAPPIGDEIVGILEGGLFVGLIAGLVFGLIPLLSGEAVETRQQPNQGTLRSIKMALATGLIVGAIVGPIFGWRGEQSFRAFTTLSVGLIFGLSLGLVGGGLFVIRHFVLRSMLWIGRSTPIRYVRFLDYAAERLFLRKVGGGYIFVHRMLLEYFASLPES